MASFSATPGKIGEGEPGVVPELGHSGAYRLARDELWVNLENGMLGSDAGIPSRVGSKNMQQSIRFIDSSWHTVRHRWILTMDFGFESDAKTMFWVEFAGGLVLIEN